MLSDKPASLRILVSCFERRSFSTGLMGLFAVLFVLLACLTLERGRPLGLAHPVVAVPPVVKQILEQPSVKEIVGTFRSNQTITDVLTGNGLSSKEVQELVQVTRPVYNLAKVTLGQPYWLNLLPGGKFLDFRYPVDEDRYLTVYRDGDDHFVPVMKKFQFDTRVTNVRGVIDGSLFGAVLDAGEQDRLAMDLAEIFGSDVDFYTDIQKGDSFRLLVEKKYLGGRFVKYGAILAAGLTNGNKNFTGFRFTDENGKAGYYAPDGKSLKRSFLKSPLKFARITSRFSLARLHPILKIVRPHLGVDYAAPQGTPVQAVGTGVVEAAGFSGDSGRMVRLRHAGSYETLYLHLSRIAVRPGTHVSQGEVIGYVGATGLATGPHLDFRILQHGRYINPSKVIFPPAPPVPPEAFARFSALRESLATQMTQSGY
jgi:murein DD-endopeptidase MepM/ murein hydrolase activator NlpD